MSKPLLSYIPDYDKSNRSEWPTKTYQVSNGGVRDYTDVPISDGKYIEKLMRKAYAGLEDVREATPENWAARHRFKEVRAVLTDDAHTHCNDLIDEFYANDATQTRPMPTTRN